MVKITISPCIKSLVKDYKRLSVTELKAELENNTYKTYQEVIKNERTKIYFDIDITPGRITEDEYINQNE